MLILTNFLNPLCKKKFEKNSMKNNIPTYFEAESTLPDYRLIATMLSGCGFAFGELVLALEAYYLRTWYYYP